MISKGLNQLIDSIKKDFALFLSISFGVFVFILFFQPFSIEQFDFNNKLIFVAGLGGIVFLFMLLIRIVLPWSVQKYIHSGDESVLPAYVGGFAIMALSSLSFAFYLQYVGQVDISFYIMFKVVLICLAPPVILKLHDAFNELKQQNETLLHGREASLENIEKHDEDLLNTSIEINSENNADNITLVIADIVFFRSADNYVEIVYREGDDFKKKLIRNTLKNIEQQLQPYDNFVRCHRKCIANVIHIEQLQKKQNNNWLTIKGNGEEIPVSRQYLLKLKDML